jgi:hypothetical protein
MPVYRQYSQCAISRSSTCSAKSALPGSERWFPTSFPSTHLFLQSNSMTFHFPLPQTIKKASSEG